LGCPFAVYPLIQRVRSITLHWLSPFACGILCSGGGGKPANHTKRGGGKMLKFKHIPTGTIVKLHEYAGKSVEVELGEVKFTAPFPYKSCTNRRSIARGIYTVYFVDKTVFEEEFKSIR
jgi:hypothetical protein